MTDRTPTDLLDAALAADAGRPLVTFYDDATGERVELSAATTANWVAKTAGLLTDEIGLAPGDPVRLALPRHWLLTVWALATWRVGAVVDLDGAPAADGGLRVCDPDGLSAADGTIETVAVSLAPLGAPFPPGSLPAGVLDYARQVPVHPDRYAGGRPGPDDVAVRVDGRGWTGAEAVVRAEALAAAWGLQPGGRLLATVDLPAADALLAATLVPLAVGGSVVLVRNPQSAEPGTLAARADAERVTATAR